MKNIAVALFLLLGASLFVGVQAQVGIDIPETETPDDGPGDGTGGGLGGNPMGCRFCCDSAGTNKQAQEICASRYPGCSCGMVEAPGGGGCFAVRAVAQSDQSMPDTFALSRNIYAMWDLLASTEGSEKVTDFFMNHSVDLIRMVQSDPAIAKDIAAFTRSNARALEGMLSGKGRVASEEYRAFRQLVSRIASSESLDAGTQKRTTELFENRLSKNMVGMPYQKALACFVNESC